MIDWQWKKKDALAEQLKFFGAKKQKFISVYAKKPRILIKVKDDRIHIDLNKIRREQIEYAAHMGSRARNDFYNQSQSALRQLQIMQGAQNTASRQAALDQMQASQQALNMQQGQFNANQGLAGLGLGSLAGLGAIRQGGIY